MSQPSGDEHTWALVAWIIPLVGGIIGIVMRSNSDYVKHWSYLSIAFGIIIIVIDIILGALSFLTILILPIHILVTVLYYLAGLAFFIIWIIGILRERNAIYWKPPIIYNAARMIGLP